MGGGRPETDLTFRFEQDPLDQKIFMNVPKNTFFLFYRLYLKRTLMYRNVNLLALICAVLVLSIPNASYGLDSLSANSAFQFLDEPSYPVGRHGKRGTAFDDGGFSFVNPAQPY